MKLGIALALSALLLVCSSVSANQIVGISEPVGAADNVCRPLSDNAWHVTTTPGTPLDIGTGIGYLIDPSVTLIPSDYVLHDHVYSAAFTPLASRATITYTFDDASVVRRVSMIQHDDGITEIEAFVGDSLDAMTSIGTAWCDDGDITGSRVLVEGQTSIFDFSANELTGKYFQFVIRKTSRSDGFAVYRTYIGDGETDYNGEPLPEPATLGLLAIGGIGALLRRRRTA